MRFPAIGAFELVRENFCDPYIQPSRLMHLPPMPTPQGRDRTLTALADPTNRAILQRLSSGEARVTEVASLAHPARRSRSAPKGVTLSATVAH